jgi:N-acetylglucosaminyl-diphospho-decaprenol L-rhamnosyltransferase
MTKQVIGLLLNYRDASRTVRCIRSLLDQGVEYVVVWDNSEDGGLSAASVATLMGKERRFDVQVSERNLGFSAGVNRALAHCSITHPQAWVLLINNDAYLLDGALRQLESALTNSKSAKIAFPSIDHSGRILGVAYYHRLTGILSWTSHRGCFAYASGCCLLIATDRIGAPLFDEAFFMYGEDWELGWRLSTCNGSMAFVDEILVEHEGSASSGLGSLFYETQMVAAHLILVPKLSHGRFERIILYVLRALMLCARALIRTWRYRSIIPIRALFRGAKMATRHQALPPAETV